MDLDRLSTRDRLALSAALLLVAVALAGVGAFAAFTGSASVSQSISSGTVSIGLGSTGTSANRLNVDASGIVPGDTIERAVTVTNTGDQDFASISLTTSASLSSLLDTDGTDGLQMVIQRCSEAWTEGGSAPAYTYTCGGSTSTVLSSTITYAFTGTQRAGTSR